MSKDKNTTKDYGKIPTGNVEKDMNSNTSNSVGPTRRYVSGNEEKSSASHQFHKSSNQEGK